MLTARHSVSDKVATTLSSIGNTVTIGPPGYAVGGLLGKNLTAAELAPIAHLHGVTGIDESLNGATQTMGASHAACPSIILADEPAGNLDTQTSATIVELLRGLSRSEGTTIILVTHDASIADQADRVLHLEDGHLALST